MFPYNINYHWQKWLSPLGTDGTGKYHIPTTWWCLNGLLIDWRKSKIHADKILYKRPNAKCIFKPYYRRKRPYHWRTMFLFVIVPYWPYISRANKCCFMTLKFTCGMYTLKRQVVTVEPQHHWLLDNVLGKAQSI